MLLHLWLGMVNIKLMAFITFMGDTVPCPTLVGNACSRDPCKGTLKYQDYSFFVSLTTKL